ncbi:LysR substrate-binding domain-containing protein [Diaphorobacter aerolatus]|uniref:LysR family transcriptional regulator n=1 Tax=Diaphorobacter aerolatus TaxID=1288495 RepID=A0A7H0GJ69_9BURK|nr:LysR substrate-binding domain-containing protein [Diaphorobacter aerolatus]QNP48335.1 LysR family transcriptional regulator [Diaphorobacter aerolatus]
MFVIQLKSFFMVARLGSITLAAKHLGLSQPTVTTQIRALEELYGIELFRRQGGRLVVSDDGVRLLPMVESLLQQESNVEFALRHAGDVNQGQLRLGTTAPYYILDVVKRFQKRYPRVDVVIGAGNSRQTSEALREFRVDLATSSHKEADARLLCVHLGCDPLALVVHRTHALAAQNSVRVTQLADCQLIVREPGSMTREKTEEMMAATGTVVQRTFEIASREAIREAVIRNMGVSVFAQHEASAHPDLRVLPFEGDVPRIDEYLYCLNERREARLIAAFLSECAGSIG